jgi:hypothetical protein
VSRLTVVNPSGEAKVVGNVAIDVATAERSRTKYVFGSFSPKESGWYVFAVEYQLEGETEWRTAAKVPLTVVLPEDTGGKAKKGDQQTLRPVNA